MSITKDVISAAKDKAPEIAALMNTLLKAHSGARLKVDKLSSEDGFGEKMLGATGKVGSTIVGREANQLVREALSFEYSFNRAVDRNNQPSGPPRGGQITVTVRALNSGNCDLLRWMTDGGKYSGKIEIFIPGTTKKMKDIEFKDGFCISYLEKWEEATATHIEKITIACREIKHGVEHKNRWGSFDSPDAKTSQSVQT